MIKLDFKIDDVIATATRMRAAPREMNLAVMRTVNWAGARAYTQVRRQLAQQTGIRQADMTRSRGLAAYKASPGRVAYEVVSRSRWTPLAYFGPVQRRKGVSARPWGKRRIFRGTFMANVGSLRGGVFQRVPNGRRVKKTRMGPKGRPVVYYSQLPIRQLWGPSLARELGTEPTPQTFRKAVVQGVQGRINHEINFVMGRIAARGR